MSCFKLIFQNQLIKIFFLLIVSLIVFAQTTFVSILYICFMVKSYHIIVFLFLGNLTFVNLLLYNLYITNMIMSKIKPCLFILNTFFIFKIVVIDDELNSLKATFFIYLSWKIFILKFKLLSILLNLSLFL